MWRKIVFLASLLFVAFSILFISVFRTASVTYDFSDNYLEEESQVLGDSEVFIDYQFPYQGKILPDSFFWPVKALRDRLWLFFTTNPTRKVELLLLFADKRAVSAKILFEQESPEIAFTTLTKAEKYLERSSVLEKEIRMSGNVNGQLLTRLANASLKHYQLIEGIITIAPEDAKPQLIEISSYSKKAFEEARNGLLDNGINPPENPFDWR